MERVQTLTAGYEHTFVVADYADSPQTLMGKSAVPGTACPSRPRTHTPKQWRPKCLSCTTADGYAHWFPLWCRVSCVARAAVTGRMQGCWCRRSSTGKSTHFEQQLVSHLRRALGRCPRPERSEVAGSHCRMEESPAAPDDRDMHPTGVQHSLNAAVSVFAFDPRSVQCWQLRAASPRRHALLCRTSADTRTLLLGMRPGAERSTRWRCRCGARNSQAREGGKTCPSLC